MNQDNYFIGPKLNWLPAGNRELLFAAFFLVLGLFSANMILFGGFNLGFAMAAVAVIGVCALYLIRSGHRGGWYEWAMLILCAVIAAGFGWSGDYAVKFVLLWFVLVGAHLALCRMAEKNRHPGGSFRSVFDGLRLIFDTGFGKMGEAARGLGMVFRSGSETARRSGAVLAGLGIAIPALAVMIPLLMASDAAFEGLIDLLPDFDLFEIVSTLVFGVGFAIYLYALCVGFHLGEQSEPASHERKQLHVLTMNTALGAVCAVYLVYLLSQTAYFVGGFAGILPAGYTAAEYARRGFFEMAWLCAINLGLIGFGVGLVRREDRAPRSTRLLCAFLVAVTLFLVTAGCAKMLLYIDLYGLTRLRVLTMVVMAFLGFTTLLVGVWLFAPKLQYMKAVILVGLSLGAAVIWLDVDTQVAKYNVEHYLSGDLDSVDVWHLSNLGGGAVPYIEQLLTCGDEAVEETATHVLEYWFMAEPEDFRSYNYKDALGSRILEAYTLPESAELDIP